ncbi:MAG: UDP-N-acetylmuramate--L-alanine ligase [bacterium]
MFHKIRTIHFVGIGGTGMCGIAEVLANLGYEVSGSDVSDGDSIRRLRRLGCRVAIGHAKENLGGAQVVVVSTAVAASNPEVVAARGAGIPVIPRAEMLAELMRMKFGIAVAGAHGKTTTTWLCSLVVDQGGFDPTIVVGGRLRALDSNARLGQGRYLVAEADESDGSFLRLSPTLAVITNLDREHLDHYGSMDKLRSTFVEFANKVPFYGAAIVCADDPLARGLLPDLHRRVITYGFSEDAEVRAVNRRWEPPRTVFTVQQRGKVVGDVSLAVPGDHNVRNALAASAVGLELGIAWDGIAKALGDFSGISRRMEIRSDADGLLVIDDYAHHPTELAATLTAARGVYSDRRLVALFQPHRYSRTQDLAEQFGAPLAKVDRLVVTSIYAAGEEPIEGVDSRGIAEAVQRAGGPPVSLVDGWEDAVDLILPETRPGDVVLTLGAGDIWKAGDLLAARFAASRAGDSVKLSRGRA